MFSNLLQLILLGTFASGFSFITDWSNFKSVLLGGGAWFIPGLYFLWRMQRIQIISDNQKILQHFLTSEGVKLLLSFGIITLILLTCNIDKKSFLIGYVVMVLISFLVPLKYRNRVKNG